MLLHINQLATLIKRQRHPYSRLGCRWECTWAASVALILIVIVVLIAQTTSATSDQRRDVNSEHELDEWSVELFKRFTAEQDKEYQSPIKSRRSLKNSHQHQQQTTPTWPMFPPIAPPNARSERATNSTTTTTTTSATTNQQLQQQSCLSTTTNENSMNHNDQDQRKSFGFTESEISRFVSPNFYTLRLKLDPNKRKFTGQLMIALEINQQQQPGAISNRNKRRTPTIQQQDNRDDDEPANSNNNNNRDAQLDSTNSSDSHRYITLHSGANINIRKAFYVLRSNVQIPATKIGRNVSSELLTLDFHPNVVGAGQGLLLLVYTGQVNETDSHGLFVHRSNKAHRRPNQAGATAALKQLTANGQNQTQTQTSSQPPDDVGLATHMQPSFARRLFPAWDEPDLKARFGLIVVLPFRGYEVISNTPIKRKSISLSCSGESLQEIEFQTTPTMSTYLLALVVGRFEHIESITQNNCKVSAHFYSAPANNNNNNSNSDQSATVNHRRQAAQMALDVAVKTFDRLEALLGVKYPLAKFDMVALRDFQSGAMENWGASLFHENYLLCCYNSSSHNDIRLAGGSVRAKRLVVPLVVAHEIAHQWFGNLITLKSWSYLWLNEGFAQLLMYDVANYLFPDENYWHIFLEDSRQAAMREDELITSSRALEPPERDADTGANLLDDQLMNLFDELTYNKGAAMVEMVALAIGREHLFAGLGHYLLKHSYDSVTSHDLWAALEESTGQPDRQLESLMFNWLKLDGFPLLTVQVLDSGGPHYTLRLRQDRFTLLPVDAMQTAPNQSHSAAALDWSNWLWSIPITFSCELHPRPSALDLRLWPGGAGVRSAWPARSATPISSVLLNEREATIVLPKTSVGRWLKLNFNSTGYYRVDYATASSNIEASSSPGNFEDAASSPGDGDKAAKWRKKKRGRRQLGESSSQPAGRQQPIDMLIRMADSIRNRSMGVLDRFNVLDDLFSMVMAGKKQVSYYLRYMDETFSNENELIVLRFMFDSLERIKSTLVMNSPIFEQLEAQFDLYAQRLLRKLCSNNSLGPLVAPTLTSSSRVARTSASSSAGADSSGWLAFYSLQLQHQQQQQQRRTSTQTSNLLELAELFDAMRANFNELELHQRSNELFARYFRPTTATTTAPSQPSNVSPFDLMGRDLRSSVYSAALNSNYQWRRQNITASRGDQLDEPPNRLQSSASSFVHSWLLSRYQTPLSSDHSNDNIQSSPSSSSSVGQRVVNSTSDGADFALNRLLELYETRGELSSSERQAICLALGSVRDPTKQALLLNLTLGQSFFRPQDSALLLESMGRLRTGRQLIWTRLTENSRQFEARQLVGSAVSSMSRSLIESLVVSQSTFSGNRMTTGANSRQNADLIEQKLKQLYLIHRNEHDKLISQAIEWVRINSQWFKRDHDNLVRYLNSVSSLVD